MMMEGKDYYAVRKNVLSWPPEERFALLQELLHTFYPEASHSGPAKKIAERRATYEDALGLLKTDAPPPTDAEVEQILEEERLKKYG